MHSILASKLGVAAPTAAQEEANPAAADSFYTHAGTWLRENTRNQKNFEILFNENVTDGYARIINARTVQRLASLIDPAKVIAGGKSDPEAHYLDPTLLYPVTWDDKIMEDEIFGPIPPILTYRSFDEAMARMAGLSVGTIGQ